MKPGITVVIPTIPPRAHLLTRALQSVERQSRPADAVIIEHDTEATGAAATRNRALEKVETEWVAFLDDDDEFMTQHLRALEQTAQESGADLVYPWYAGINQTLFPHSLSHVDFGPEQREYILTRGNFIPITVLVRTEALRSVGGFTPSPNHSPEWPNEDWATWVKLLQAGFTFVRHHGVTWVWNGHPGHTSGRPWTMKVPR